MKKQVLYAAAIFVPLMLLVAVVYYRTRPVPVPVPVPVQVPVPVPEPEPVVTYVARPSRTVPEYREPPLKEYRPANYQQVGLLLGGPETLPLYGKESLTRRNQWHYYTTTPGNQIYPLPVSSNGRDCMEDTGCNELYGNETLNVTGRDGTDFQAKIYRTENFPYMM